MKKHQIKVIKEGNYYIGRALVGTDIVYKSEPKTSPNAAWQAVADYIKATAPNAHQSLGTIDLQPAQTQQSVTAAQAKIEVAAQTPSVRPPARKCCGRV